MNIKMTTTTDYRFLSWDWHIKYVAGFKMLESTQPSRLYFERTVNLRDEGSQLALQVFCLPNQWWLVVLDQEKMTYYWLKRGHVVFNVCSNALRASLIKLLPVGSDITFSIGNALLCGFNSIRWYDCPLGSHCIMKMPSTYQ